jgi:hypothetical protein
LSRGAAHPPFPEKFLPLLATSCAMFHLFMKQNKKQDEQLQIDWIELKGKKNTNR